MVRVRYPPSPTGDPHIGNIRTALFNYLFAKKSGGTFLLRIEDTDQKRYVPGSVERIIESLRWLGLTWDEGPFYQSKRLSLYKEAAQKLVDGQRAYYCFCTPERLAAMRKEQEAQGKPPRYDRKCLSLDKEEIAGRFSQHVPYVIRLTVPQEGITTFEDIIRGPIEFRNEVLDDQVLIKSDGFPTYHLAVVIDDHDMQVTHVIRAEEWLSSTPKHILLYQYFGWQLPQFAHLPVIVEADRSKLSKRHGAESVLAYRDQGYLPEALVNFMALLGWAPGDNREVLSLVELIEAFSLDRVQKSPAFFDRKKLDWFNGFYIRKLLDTELVFRLRPFVPSAWEEEHVARILPLVKDRMSTLKDFQELAAFFFAEPHVDAALLANHSMDAHKLLSQAQERLSGVSWEHDAIEGAMRTLADVAQVKHGDLFMMLRVAITGRTVTPPLFATMHVLGKEKVLQRIANASRLT